MMMTRNPAISGPNGMMGRHFDQTGLFRAVAQGHRGRNVARCCFVDFTLAGGSPITSPIAVDDDRCREAAKRPALGALREAAAAWERRRGPGERETRRESTEPEPGD